MSEVLTYEFRNFDRKVKKNSITFLLQQFIYESADQLDVKIM